MHGSGLSTTIDLCPPAYQRYHGNRPIVGWVQPGTTVPQATAGKGIFAHTPSRQLQAAERRKRASRPACYSFVQIICLGRVRIDPDDRPFSAGVVVGEDATGARWYTVKRHAGLASGHAIGLGTVTQV